MKLHLTYILTAATLLAATPAVADETPPPLPALPAKTAPTAPAGTIDAVHLRNGGLYRGHVTEIVPGDHVTIYVDKGEEKRIAWSEVERVIVATTSVPPVGTNAPPGSGDQVGARTIPAATPPVAAPMVGPKVHVHITAASTVILYRRPSGTTSWVQACVSPCNMALPLGDSYRVTGNSVSQSAEFGLQGNPNSSIDIKVDPQSTGGMVLGGALAGAGALVGYVGLLLVAISLDTSHRNNDDERTVGLVAMGLGAVATLAGVLVFLSSAKTDVSQNQPAGPTPPSNDAFRRLPTWRTAERSGMPTGQFPVLFSHSF